MIKALVKDSAGNNRCLMLGLSFGNLQKFRDQPLDTFIPINGAQFGLPCDVIIFSGETEADMEAMVRKIGEGRENA